MKRPKLKNLLVNLSLSLLSLLVCLGMVEGVLRWMGYGNIEIYQPDPLLYWRLKPNQDCYTKVDHKPVHVNSQGTRGREFSPAKPPGTLRILSLGDSRTFGWGLSESETYSGILERLIQDRLGDARKVEVINAGVNAWSYAQMRVYFHEIGLKYQPDWVILANANYWTQFSENNSPEFVKKFMRRVWLKNFLRHFALYHYIVEVKLRQVYERQRVKFIPVDPKQDALFKEQQQRDPDAVFREAVEGLSALALSNQVQPLLLYLPTLTALEATNQHSDLKIKTEVSRRLNLPLVDLTPDLLSGKGSNYLEADPVHFNVAGNDLIARRLFQGVTNLLIP